MTELYRENEPLTLTLCLEEDSILIGKPILDALDHPKQVQMLINDEKQMLLLQACTVDDREAVVIPHMQAQTFEMSGHALLKRIRRLTGWTDSRPRVVFGNCIPSHKAIVFDLGTARIAPVRSPWDGHIGIPS